MWYGKHSSLFSTAKAQDAWWVTRNTELRGWREKISKSWILKVWRKGNSSGTVSLWLRKLWLLAQWARWSLREGFILMLGKKSAWLFFTWCHLQSQPVLALKVLMQIIIGVIWNFIFRIFVVFIGISSHDASPLPKHPALLLSNQIKTPERQQQQPGRQHDTSTL